MGKSQKRPVDDYYFSVHYGVALTVDELVDIRIKEKTAWEGSITTNTELTVSDRYLFGGDDGQGGVSGVVDVLFGDPTQVLSETLANRLTDENDLPLTSATAPGFRGFTSLFFRGAGASAIVSLGGIAGLLRPVLARNGFLWGSSNPVIPPVDVRVRRVSGGLSAGTRSIVDPDSDRIDANPAHMIYECCTNVDFGSGLPDTSLDLTSFQNAAQTLFDEGFGLSTVWYREETIEDFIQDILSHINAVMFVDVSTGLLNLKLIRDDYDVNTLEVLTADDVTVTDFDRKARGEIINSTTVTYTNPDSLNDETVTVVDEAGISMQNGEEINSSSEFRLVKRANLATQLAERELRVGAAPLSRGKIRGKRAKLAAIKPGDVFILDYPEYELTGTEQVVCRVTEINYGKTNQPEIIVSWIEDIYVLPLAPITPRQASLEQPINESPSPLSDQSAISLPYALVTQIPDTDFSDADYPDSYVGLLGDQSGQDTQGFVAFADAVRPDGSTETEALGLKPLTDSLTLQAALVAEAETAVMRVTTPTLFEVATGDLLHIQATDEVDSELVMILELLGSTVAGTVDYRVARGVLDTTPKAHANGSTVWHISTSYSSWDTQTRLASVTTEYTLLPQTSLGILNETLAVPLNVTPYARPYLPQRPANVQVDGTGFGEVSYDPEPVDITVTWANRNRLTEDVIFLDWTAAGVTVEDGQTVEIDIVDVGGTVIHTETVTSGETVTLPIAVFGVGGNARVRVYAVRDGLRSFQAHEITVLFPARGGYGISYGQQYGA